MREARGDQLAMRAQCSGAFRFPFGERRRIQHDQIKLPGAMFEQFVKRGADGGFVFDAELGEFGE